MALNTHLTHSIMAFALLGAGFMVLIVFEGIDGGGKQTQIDLLSRHLRNSGIEFSLYKYPTKLASLLHRHLNNQIPLDLRTKFFLFSLDLATGQQKI